MPRIIGSKWGTSNPKYELNVWTCRAGRTYTDWFTALKAVYI